MATIDRSFSQVLLDHLCQQELLLRGLLSLCSVVFVLLLVSLTVVNSGSATYVIVIIDLVSVTVVGSITVVLLIICQRKQAE